LCNFGVLPLEFVNPADKKLLAFGQKLSLDLTDLGPGVKLTVKNLATGSEVPVKLDVSARQAAMLKAGGLLAQMADNNKR
jgi:aconitate hydratase